MILLRRRHIPAKGSIYPFKSIHPKLTRADIEWLLATHESAGSIGPVDWGDEKQHNRMGLDLRGADLSHLDLRKLPLARLHGGLSRDEWTVGSWEQRVRAEVHLEGANLSQAHLEGASLARAYLQMTNLFRTNFAGADLVQVHLEGANLVNTYLAGASLRNAFFDAGTTLRGVTLTDTRNGPVFLADVRWGTSNLSRVDWEQLTSLGDEREAAQPLQRDGSKKANERWLTGYGYAVRANRQLALALRAQGVNEAGERFAYQALLIQRTFLWWQLRTRKFSTRKFSALGSYFFSWFLAVLTGYGFRTWRIMVAYVLLILAFAGMYWELDRQSPHPFSFWQAIILSVTAFHGRVFANPFNLSNPQIVVTAIEAIFGLVIEGVFIAMLTQRFFNR